MRSILLSYFKFFSQKNIEKLDKIFSDSIILKDWTVKIVGKKKVLNFNKKLFKKFKYIKVSIKEIIPKKLSNTFYCKIEIKLDKKRLNVIDIISFNKKFKIRKIEAYLG
tara:strand:+ start:1046 stop:1372 length:327 start_codon:yes stop_codon:yes gene_type:complete